MNAMTIVVALLAIAVIVGGARVLRTKPRRWTGVALQVVVAVALYLCLFPPTTREDFATGELVVLTPGATPAQLASFASATNVVALPNVDVSRGMERVPDLGTALRRHADVRRLHIVGGGLPPRDRDAARGLVAAFDAAPLPRGLVELAVPSSVPAGSVWRLDGRAEGVADGRVELRDPAGAAVASQTLDTQGHFVLHANAKGEGGARFTLDLLDRDGTKVDSVPLPLAVRAGTPLKVLLLAGAPDPDLKYLRRWAADSGLSFDSRVTLSEGMALTEGTATFDGEALRAFDVAIVDERAWATLDAQHKQALIAAVHDGLGLLLRVTGPLPEPVAADWAALGYRLQADDDTNQVRLDRRFGFADPGFALTRDAGKVEAGDAAPLLRADDGTVLAWSRDIGLGRVGLWLLADSYRLSLGGAGAAFGSLWSGALTSMARARGEAAPTLPVMARADERAVFCGVAGDVAVANESGAKKKLIVDPATGCAAYWPDEAGEHVLLSGDQRLPFEVLARDAASKLAAGEAARATRALVGTSSATAAIATRDVPLPRWPFFLVFLALAAVLWWLERRASTDDAHSE
jgi:hypothetical protein